MRQYSELSRYVEDISRFKVLSREEEAELATEYVETRDPEVEQRLINANLRFVVKVAGEYRGYGLPMLDLIQEGNMGLLRAVEKFDPTKGNRLVSYAVWWIKAYIQGYVMRSWSLVKIGTTQAQRRLFFRVRSERDRVIDGVQQSDEMIAERLGVKVDEVQEMGMRMRGRDGSLDIELHEDGRESWVSQIEDQSPAVDETVGRRSEQALLRGYLDEALKRLNEREKFIIESRLMADEPLTLQQIGDRFGVSRERARQIESALLGKLKTQLQGTELAH